MTRENKITCPLCNGSAARHDGTPCPECKGSGSTADHFALAGPGWAETMAEVADNEGWSEEEKRFRGLDARGNYDRARDQGIIRDGE